MNEEWRAIDGWPYEVSNLGRVRPLKRRAYMRGETLQPRRHTNGYLRVNLCQDGEQRDFYIHRLVCAAFVGPAPFPGAEVDHKNGRRDENHDGNLRWLTVTENRELRNIARGERAGNARLTADQVAAIRASTENRTVLARRYGVSPKHIWKIRTNKSWRTEDARIG